MFFICLNYTYLHPFCPPDHWCSLLEQYLEKNSFNVWLSDMGQQMLLVSLFANLLIDFKLQPALFSCVTTLLSHRRVGLEASRSGCLLSESCVPAVKLQLMWSWWAILCHLTASVLLPSLKSKDNIVRIKKGKLPEIKCKLSVDLLFICWNSTPVDAHKGYWGSNLVKSDQKQWWSKYHLWLKQKRQVWDARGCDYTVSGSLCVSLMLCAVFHKDDGLGPHEKKQYP